LRGRAIISCMSFINSMPGPLQQAMLGIFFGNTQNQKPAESEMTNTLASTQAFNDVFLAEKNEKALATMLKGSVGDNRDDARSLLETLLHLSGKTNRRMAVHQTESTDGTQTKKSFHQSSFDNFKLVETKLNKVIAGLVGQFKETILEAPEKITTMIDFARDAVGLNDKQIKKLGLVATK